MNNESFFLDVSFSSWFSFPFSQFNSTSFIFRPRACCTLATSSATHCRATTWAKTDPQTEIEPKSTTVSRQDNRVLHLFTMAFNCYYEINFPPKKCRFASVKSTRWNSPLLKPKSCTALVELFCKYTLHRNRAGDQIISMVYLDLVSLSFLTSNKVRYPLLWETGNLHWIAQQSIENELIPTQILINMILDLSEKEYFKSFTLVPIPKLKNYKHLSYYIFFIGIAIWLDSNTCFLWSNHLTVGNPFDFWREVERLIFS